LKSPVERVTFPDAPVPASTPLERAYFPDCDDIIEAVKRTLEEVKV
jgi:pyruvate dehydrogenase E1 component beta subunit